MKAWSGPSFQYKPPEVRSQYKYSWVNDNIPAITNPISSWMTIIIPIIYPLLYIKILFYTNPTPCNKDLRTARIFTQKLPFQRSRETDDRYQPADCIGNFKWAEHMALVNLPFEPPLRAASLPLFSMNKTPVFPDNMVFQETWSIELIGRLRPEIPGIPQEKHTKSPADSLLLTSSWRVYKPNRSINESTLQKTTVLSGLKWIIFHQPGFAWNDEISLP